MRELDADDFSFRGLSPKADLPPSAQKLAVRNAPHPSRSASVLPSLEADIAATRLAVAVAL